MIKAKHNFLIYPFFKWYATFIIKRNFNSYNIIGDVKAKNRPILLISNHMSWWDGFWVMYVNLKTFQRKFHFMMLEEQLKKFWFFNYTGGFSINKNSKSIIETLNYTSNLLKDNNNLVLIFPQGKIQSMHTRNISFEKGIERIIKDNEGKIEIVFQANCIDYFSSKKPNLYIHIQTYSNNSFLINDIQSAYNQFYEACLNKQLTYNY